MAAAALLVFVPIAVLSVALVEVAFSATRSQAERQVEASAAASASAVEQELGRLADVVATYGDLSLTSEALEADDDASLQALIGSLYENPNVDLAFVVDETGALLDVLPETPSAIGRDFSFRDWYQGASAAGAVYVSEAYQPATDLSLIVVAASPVFASDGSGEVVGFIGTGLNLVGLQEYIDEFARTQEVSLTVTDQAGVVVAEPGAAPASIESRRHEPMIEAALRGGSSLREVDRNGVAHLSAAAAVDVYGWTITAEVPTADALVARTQILTVAVVLAALLLLAAAASLVKISRSLRGYAESVQRRKESESFLESIVENLPSGVAVKDARSLEFVQVNSGALAMLRVDRDDFLGSSPADYLERSVAEKHAERDRRIIEGGTAVELRAVVMPERFGDLTLNVRKIPITSGQGEVTHLLEIFEDVTDLLASMHELETAWAEAEKANEAKSEFLSRMSHELRTPLNAVLGFGQLLEFEDLTDQQLASVQQILRGGRHLLGLINEVLDISRIETGNLSLSVEPVALDHLIDETLELVRPLADDAGLTLPVGPMPDWSVWVRADQQRLRQVLLNLLSNAVKYNELGGSISIRCREIQGRRLRLSVSDTGSGLTPEQIDRLFSPFERLGVEASGIQGSGLGLALSKRLVEAMHGTIGVESQPGIGSTFWVELGLCDASDLMSGPAAPSVSADRIDDVPRLLHVEDSLDNLRWVEHLLADRPDVELISVADAETALDMVRRFQPDLLLLDVEVAGADPAELVRQLAADPAPEHLLVITVGPTAEGLPMADRHLERPVADADLLAAVADLLAVAAASALTRPSVGAE